MVTHGKFWQHLYGWVLLPGLVLLWLLTFNTGRSLAQTPTPTATPLLLPRQSADLLRARVDAQTAAAAAAAQLQARSDGTLWVDYNPTTGAARWVATEGTALTHEFAGRNLSPEASARAFLGAYGRIFGVADQAAELQLTQIKGDHLGGQHVAFQQQQAGIKVFGADLKVHLDGTGAVKLINGYTLPTARGLSMTPTLSPDQAAQAAVRTTGLADGVVISNTLVILNPGLITDQSSPTYLTYQVQVDSATQPDAAVWLFIDAATGEVRFSYPAVTDARNRNTYNAQHGSTSGALLARNETSAAVTSVPNCSVNDINRAHDYTGQAYDFYFTRFGRDSYDGAGAAMNSYVCYGVDYRNAAWTGSYMQYGDGFVLDDVAGHELSHAVTQYISGLIYSGQSGALNESFSDMMGEALDLTNNSGNDAAAVRWDIGEELPNIGAIRDMMDPTRFRNPDRTDSPDFDCFEQDVHINSGVQNKAFALMVDGGVFNNYTIAPIGLDKAVQIIYLANDLYLTASAKFIDAYNAINRSCTEFYGPDSADCTNVKKALDATGMAGPVCGVVGVPQPTPTPDPAYPNVVNGDFEAGRNVGWSETDTLNAPVISNNLVQTGKWAAWLVGRDNDISTIAQSYTVPATGGTLAYAYKIESRDQCGYDFGYVEVNTTILKTYNLCTTTATTGYVAGSVSLTPYAGQTITIRFRATTNPSAVSNFHVDNVAVITFRPTATPANTPTNTPTNTPVPPTPTPTTNPLTVVAWGNSVAGAGSVPAGLQAIAVAGGSDHSLALKSDGTVVAWGCGGTMNRGQCTVPAGLTTVIAIAAGSDHSLALKSDGTVVAWGCAEAGSNYGQCTVPTGLTGVSRIIASRGRSLALKRDGTVVNWGCGPSDRGQCTTPTGLSGVTAVAAGESQTLALKSDGTAVAWGCGGNYNYGQCTVPAGLTTVIAIAAGTYQSLALKGDGTVVAWGCGGTGNFGQCTIPAGLTNVIAIAAGIRHSLALKGDGAVVAWGCVGTGANFGQCTIPAGLSGVTAISAGYAHNLALTRNTGVAAATAVTSAGEESLVADQPLTTTAVVSASAVVDLSVQNQRLFLPLVANLGTMAASDSAAGAPVSDTVAQSAPPTTPAAVITTSVPVSVPAVVEAASVVTASASVVSESVPVSVPAAVEAAPVVSESVPVSEPAAVVEAAPAVTETLLLTTTTPITNAAANPLAGTAVGNRGGIVVLALVGLAVVGSLLWQRRRSSAGR